MTVPEPTTLVTRGIPSADYQRFTAEAAERGVSMEALSRQLIHELAEQRRLAERAAAMDAYTHNPDRMIAAAAVVTEHEVRLP